MLVNANRLLVFGGCDAGSGSGAAVEMVFF